MADNDVWLALFSQDEYVTFFVTSPLPVILDESVREDMILVYMESVLIENAEI